MRVFVFLRYLHGMSGFSRQLAASWLRALGQAWRDLFRAHAASGRRPHLS
jgi:hypothetical protein